MNINIIARGMDATETMKNSIDSKISRLSKYFAEDAEVKVTISSRKDLQKIEVTIPTKVGVVRAEDESRDLYSSIDTVCERIEKQIKKFKSKLIDKKHSSVPFSQTFIEEPAAFEEGEIIIAKAKKFDVMPMTAEEACLQMEMSGHDFFAFLSADTNLISVVYKRKDKTYGLIEPEV